MTPNTTSLQKRRTGARRNCERKGNGFANRKSQRKPRKSSTGRPRFPERSPRQPSITEVEMLDAIIRVHVAKGPIARYQELLRAEWSRETLDEVLALLWTLIAEGTKPDKFPWQKVLEFGTARKSAKDF